MKSVTPCTTKQLIEQYPNLSHHRGGLYLVKYGGAAMESSGVRQAVCEEIALLSNLGIRIVVVHGGGKEISRTLERLSIPSEFIGGLRVTSLAAMSAIEMVLSGAINKELASRITHSGAPAIGLSGRDAHILEGAVIKGAGGVDLGLAGEATRCNTTPLLALLDAQLVPVVSPIAETQDGTPLNINADYAAAALAGALHVSGCIFLTDVDGVRDRETIAESLTPQAIEELMANGIITGGMIPKVQCAIQALRAGCRQATICNAAKPAIVSQAITGSAGAGTTIHPA
jgi:acetylglutamate kinase